MAASTFAALINLFKRLYVGRPEALRNQALRRTPAFKVISKMDDLVGEGIHIPLNSALPVGAAGNFAKARANTKPSKVDRWFIQRKPYYGFVTVEGEAMAASRDNAGAFLKVKRKEADEAVSYIGAQIGASFWGDGAGNIGQIASVTGSNPVTAITLSNPRDAVHFHEGQRIVFATSANRTGASTRTDGSVEIIYQVDGVNYVTGVLTVSRVQGTTAASDPAATNYIYIDGNYDSLMSGVSAYIPASDPGTGGVPAALNGVTRTSNPTIKAGWRGTWEGSITESTKRLCALMGQYHTSNVSAVWLSPFNWYRLEQEQESLGKVTRDQRSEAVFGTGAIALQTPYGMVPVMADPFAPEDSGFLLDHTTWEIHHLMGLPHVNTDDGLDSLRLGTEDAIEIQFRAWVNAVCTAPFRNGRFPIQ
jgi:hypothetical protein